MSIRRNVYIRKEDVEVFEQAEQLAGENFSAMIAEAVRHFVEVEEAKKDNMTEQEIEVGTYPFYGADDTKRIKFIGRKIASARSLNGQTSSRDDRGTDYSLYFTKKKKYLLYQKCWTRWQGEDHEAAFQIYDNLAEIGDSVPGSLLKKAGEALGVDVAEYLDV